MKTCPYCAEDIKDAAIRCRWCHAWLVDEVPEGADADRPPAGAMTSSSEAMGSTSGTGDSGTMSASSTSGKADTSKAESMSEREPAPSSNEPTTAMTPSATMTGSAGAGSTSTSTGETAEATSGASDTGPSSDAKVEFTHTGSRYLLGYGGDFFGIWDRNAPQQPIERFPRNDQGWASAWQRYASIEQNWMDLRTGQKSQ